MCSNYQGTCNNCYKISEYGSGCNLCGGQLELTKVKPKSSLNQDQLKAIQLVEGVKNKAQPFGSFIFKAQTYPSDLDVIELVEACCTKIDVINKMNKIFKNIIKKIKNKRGYYYSEIKAGIDEIYNFLPIKFKDYDFEYIRSYIHDLKNNELLTDDETIILDKLIKKNISKDDFDKLKEFFRKKYTLRWTQQEVLKGEKKLTGDRKIKFKDALTHKSIIKIDTFAPINGRYIEVTNFFILVQVGNNNSKSKFLNFSFDYANQIRAEIKKYNSRTFYKPFKMAKRMWALARYTQKFDDLEKLTPLFQSGTAILNQISSEIETMILMLQKLKSLPKSTILKQIDSFKSRIAFVYEFNVDEIDLDKLIDEITVKYADNKKVQISKLEEIKNYLKYIIINQTIDYLTSVGLYPVPEFYLPNDTSTLVDGYYKTSNLFYTRASDDLKKNLYNIMSKPLIKNNKKTVRFINVDNDHRSLEDTNIIDV